MANIIRWRNLETGLEAQLDPALLKRNSNADRIGEYRIVRVDNKNSRGLTKMFLKIIPFNSMFSLIIPKDEFNDIQIFSEKHSNLPLPKKVVIQFIVSLNQLLANEIDFIEKGKKDQLFRDFESAGKDEAMFLEIIDYYEKRYLPIPSRNLNYELDEITFRFTNKTFKLRNHFFKLIVMDLLMKNYEKQYKTLSFKEYFTIKKQKIAAELFVFLYKNFYKRPFNSKLKIFEFIADLFNVSGLEEVNRDVVKTWYTRFSKKEQGIR